MMTRMVSMGFASNLLVPFTAKEHVLAHIRRRVVLVSTPGLVQKATELVLASCPEVDLVATASGALSATDLLSKLQPDLVVLDATLAEREIEALLTWIKRHYPDVQCTALTVTSRQQELVLNWGADAAIHRARLNSELKAMLGCRSEAGVAAT